MRLSDEVETKQGTHASASGVVDRFQAVRHRRAKKDRAEVSSARYAGVLGAFPNFGERAQGHGKTRINLTR
jgi:hypothetical protein